MHQKHLYPCYQLDIAYKVLESPTKDISEKGYEWQIRMVVWLARSGRRERFKSIITNHCLVVSIIISEVQAIPNKQSNLQPKFTHLYTFFNPVFDAVKLKF